MAGFTAVPRGDANLAPSAALAWCYAVLEAAHPGSAMAKDAKPDEGEGLRERAEQRREDEEWARRAAEHGRVHSEELRETAEQARRAAEKARSEAEAARRETEVAGRCSDTSGTKRALGEVGRSRPDSYGTAHATLTASRRALGTTRGLLKQLRANPPRGRRFAARVTRKRKKIRRDFWRTHA